MQAVERRVVRSRFSIRGPNPTSKWLPRRNRQQQKHPFYHDRTRLLQCFAHSDEDENDEENLHSPIGSGKGIEDKVEKILRESSLMKSAIDRIAAASKKYEETVRSKLGQQQQAEIDRLERRRDLALAEMEAEKKKARAAKLGLLAERKKQNLLKELAKQNAERLESVKAFTVSSIGGLVSLVPSLVVVAGDPESDFLSLLATSLASGLYGITYRYAVGNGQNVQLKLGVVGAFWIVSTLSYAQSVWSSVAHPLSHFDIYLFGRIGLQSVQTLLIFLASTFAMELSIRSGFLHYSRETSQS